MPDIESTKLDRNISPNQAEDERAYSAQKFFERATPLWFNWLGWIFATGGVAYLAEKTGSSYLILIEKVSYFLLMMYFMYFFGSLRVEPYHSWAFNLKSKRKKAIAITPPLILGLSFALISNALVTNIIQQIKMAN